jgi:cellulase/cellobiase CelA1
VSVSPSVSASPSVSPSVSPTGGPPTGASATYAVTNAWGGGFQAEVTVTAGAAPIAGWTVTWAFPDGQVIN